MLRLAVEEERGHQRTPRVCVDPSCLDDSDHATHEAASPLEEFDVGAWIRRFAKTEVAKYGAADETGAWIHDTIATVADAFTREVGTVWRRKG